MTKLLWLFMANALAACVSSAPQPFISTEQLSVSATIAAVDQNNRAMTLHTDAKGDFTVVATPELQLGDVKAGDTVRVTYLQAISARLSPCDEPRAGLIRNDINRTGPSDKSPSTTRGYALSSDFIVADNDPGAQKITLRDAEGRERMLQGSSERFRKFIERLKQGDIVTITFIEAIAAEVRSVR